MLVFSNETALLVLGLLTVPTILVAVLNLLLRKRGGVDATWFGAVFVALCWITALTLILRAVRT